MCKHSYITHLHGYILYIHVFIMNMCKSVKNTPFKNRSSAHVFLFTLLRVSVISPTTKGGNMGPISKQFRVDLPHGSVAEYNLKCKRSYDIFLHENAKTPLTYHVCRQNPQFFVVKSTETPTCWLVHPPPFSACLMLNRPSTSHYARRVFIQFFFGQSWVHTTWYSPKSFPDLTHSKIPNHKLSCNGNIWVHALLVLGTSSFINQSEDLTEASENPGSPHFSQVFPRLFHVFSMFFPIFPRFFPIFPQVFPPFLDPQKTAGPTFFSHLSRHLHLIPLIRSS